MCPNVLTGPAYIEATTYGRRVGDGGGGVGGVINPASHLEFKLKANSMTSIKWSQAQLSSSNRITRQRLLYQEVDIERNPIQEPTRIHLKHTATRHNLLGLRPGGLYKVWIETETWSDPTCSEPIYINVPSDQVEGEVCCDFEETLPPTTTTRARAKQISQSPKSKLRPSKPRPPMLSENNDDEDENREDDDHSDYFGSDVDCPTKKTVSSSAQCNLTEFVPHPPPPVADKKVKVSDGTQTIALCKDTQTK